MNPFLVMFLEMANLENKGLVEINSELLDNHLLFFPNGGLAAAPMAVARPGAVRVHGVPRRREIEKEQRVARGGADAEYQGRGDSWKKKKICFRLDLWRLGSGLR